MNIRKLTSTLAKLEKTKSQAKIQAIRSIVGHLSDIIYKEWGMPNDEIRSFHALYLNGERRAKKARKK